MWIIIHQNKDRHLFNEFLVKFTYLVGMIADQNFMAYVLHFQPTAYGPTLLEMKENITQTRGTCLYFGTRVSLQSNLAARDKEAIQTQGNESESVKSWPSIKRSKMTIARLMADFSKSNFSPHKQVQSTRILLLLICKIT